MLTTHEAAALLGVSVRRVQALIAAGKLVAERRGRDWFIDRDSVMQRKENQAMDTYANILATVVENGQLSEGFDLDELDTMIDYEARIERGLSDEETAAAIAYARAHIQR